MRPVRPARTYFGAWLVCDNRDMIQATLLHFGVWEPDVSAVFHGIVRPGDMVVDVGANIGYYSLLASSLVGQTGSVLAVEALPSLAAVVERHASQNGADNIRVANVAASDRRGMLPIFEAPGTNVGMTTTLPNRGFAERCKVAALPLSEILTPEERRRTRFIKIDIEGAELPVLRNLLSTLGDYASDLSILVEASIDEAPDEWCCVFASFLDAGFSAFAVPNDYSWSYYMNWKRPAPPVPIQELPHSQTDILFTRVATWPGAP
jgi:FkbM family methyltransferase